MTEGRFRMASSEIGVARSYLADGERASYVYARLVALNVRFMFLMVSL